MPVLGENLVPLGRAGTGAAVVLGKDLSPLRILQQSDAIRARRAAADALAKQKQAQDIARQWSEDRKLNLDTGGLFQEAFNDYTANAQDIIGGNFAQEQAGKLTTAQRIQANANYINEVTRERLLGVDKDKTLAAYETSQQGKPYRDIQGLHTAIGQAVLGPDGKRLRASQVDERALLNQFDTDASTYNVDPILGDYYKGLQASTIDEANAGRVGGVHSSSSLTYKGLIPVKRSDGTWDVKRDAVGRPVIGTTADELATARASNHNLNMAVSRLEKEYEARRAVDSSLPERTPLDLFQEASRKYVSFRQADSEGRNAMPRAAAGGKQKNPPVYAAPVEGDYTAPGQVDQQGTQAGLPMQNFDVVDGLPAAYQRPLPGQVPKGPQQNLAYSRYSVPAPVHGTASGQNKPYSTDVNGVSFRQALVQGEDGKYHWRTNIDKPFVGSFGDAIALPVNKATGAPLTPADGAAYEKAVRDPQNEVRSFVQVITPKNKNFTAQFNERFNQLKSERARQQDGDILGRGKYNTDAELQDQAREDATQGTTISYVPNYGQDARTLDGLTSSAPQANYRAHREGVAGHQQRIRGSQPKTKADPLGFTPKQAAKAAPKIKTVGKNNALGF